MVADVGIPFATVHHVVVCIDVVVLFIGTVVIIIVVTVDIPANLVLDEIAVTVRLRLWPLMLIDSSTHIIGDLD